MRRTQEEMWKEVTGRFIALGYSVLSVQASEPRTSIIVGARRGAVAVPFVTAAAAERGCGEHLFIRVTNRPWSTLSSIERRGCTRMGQRADGARLVYRVAAPKPKRHGEGLELLRVGWIAGQARLLSRWDLPPVPTAYEAYRSENVVAGEAPPDPAELD